MKCHSLCYFTTQMSKDPLWLCLFPYPTFDIYASWKIDIPYIIWHNKLLPKCLLASKSSLKKIEIDTASPKWTKACAVSHWDPLQWVSWPSFYLLIKIGMRYFHLIIVDIEILKKGKRKTHARMYLNNWSIRLVSWCFDLFEIWVQTVFIVQVSVDTKTRLLKKKSNVCVHVSK